MHYLAFDAETTGLNPQENDILSIHFKFLNDKLETIDEKTIKIKSNCYKNVSPYALNVNKIDLVKHSFSESSVNLKDAKEILILFLGRCLLESRWRLIPVGHNVVFDIAFIKTSLLTENEYFKFFTPTTIDTLVIAQFFKSIGKIPEKQSLSLKNLCEYYSLNEKQNFHDCVYDTDMTVKLFKRFKTEFLV